jgi:type I restriction enzyme R subunit
VDEDNPPAPFHVYTMQQAIEEGFILDVLRNYTAYHTAFKLGEKLAQDHRVDSKQARRALAKWLSLHPTNVAQKVELIVEHFRGTVARLLNGQAKAMVVTGSRAAAVKYKLELDRYVQENGYAIRALVAFSGKVCGEDVDPGLAGEEFTETSMNPDTRGQDLRLAFDANTYQLMLVANKFQTGFDQPKLVAMYLDKRLSGVEAVQTLSRLNRTYAGKDRTYVIDFANDPEEILAAFRLFYREARIEDVQDPNVVYDLEAELDTAFIYTAEEVRQFGGEIARREPRQPRLFAITDPATKRFNGKLDDLNDLIARNEAAFQRCHAVGDEAGAEQAERERSEHTRERDALMRFKDGLGKFVRVYEYIAQLVDFGDAELEAFAGYARLLRNRLAGINPEEIDLEGLQLTHYALKDRGELQGVAEPGAPFEAAEQRPIKGEIGDPRDRERAFLSELVRKLNALFGAGISDADQVMFAVHITEKLRSNDAVMAQVQHNPKEQALKADLPDAATEAIIEAMTSHGDMANRLLSDTQAMHTFTGLLYDLLKRAQTRGLLELRGHG